MSLSLRDGLRARGHRADLFTSTARPLAALPILSDHTCYGSTGRPHHVLQALNPLAPRALRRVIRRFKPDVVHLRMFMTQLSPLILPELRGVPTVFHVVNYNVLCPLNTKRLPDGTPCTDRPGAACGRNGCLGPLGLLRTRVQFSLWHRHRDAIDRVVANSHWTAARLEAEDVPVDRVIHNGVPLRAARPPLSADAPPRVGYAGRLIDKKGVDTLIRAFAAAKIDVPAAELVLCGDGPARAELEALTRTLGIADAVRFTGHLSRPELEEALAGCWVQVAPSRWEEPFGLVAAEAAVRGTAALVSRRGGLAEQVLPGETGETFANEDIEELAGHLRALLADRERCEALGAAARRHALNHFLERHNLDAFLGVYAELLEARGR